MASYIQEKFLKLENNFKNRSEIYIPYSVYVS